VTPGRGHLKILIINWQDIKNPLAGGAEVHLHEIFSRVAKMGHEVTLFCSSFENAPPEETISGIRVIREGGRNFFNFRVPVRYWRRFRKEAYDVVIDDMNKIPFLTPLYVRPPLVIIIHHLFDKSIFREASPLAASYVYLTEKLGVIVARWKHVPLMVVSPSTRDEMLGKGFREDDIEIVQNCVDHHRHRPDPSQRSALPTIAYFGRLKKYKSVDHLLRAFALMKNTLPDVRLLVIGEGDYRPVLEELSRDLGIAGHVRFTGFVDEATKVSLLQESWFLVNTSFKEGWGLTVIEANACGTPVIGSNVPGLRDAINDGVTGLLYEYGNVQELAEKMRILLEDRPLRERLTQAAIAWARTFDWSEVAAYTVQRLEKQISHQG
jgi:glycosyltransferase involved in cell wall biosynthesis